MSACPTTRRRGRAAPGRPWRRRPICGRGGKSAVRVDEEAVRDGAVQAAVASGYGFQGQKCSAGSRLVVTAPVYRHVLDAFVEKVRALEVGPAPENFPVGPVINDRAKQSILNYIQVGMKEGRLAAGGGARAGA